MWWSGSPRRRGCTSTAGRCRRASIRRRVTVTSTPPLEVAPARYPPTEPHYVRGLGMELSAYAGAVEVVVPLLPERAEGTFAIEVGVRYQACSESECLLPRSERLLLEAPAGILVPGRGRPA